MKKRKTGTALLWLIALLIPLMQPRLPVEAAGMSAVLLKQASYEEAADDWETLLERLDAAIAEGREENVNFQAGNRFTVPEGILERLAGKNVTLGLHTSNGVTFSISGKDVKATDTPVNMEVVYETDIPGEAMVPFQGYPIVKQFCMADKESYPCRLNVHMALGEENAGKHAVLCFYDENNGSLRQEAAFRITPDGHAIFGINRGDEYIVILMEGYTVQPGDTLYRTARRYKISLEELREANPQISDIDRIVIGQPVNIPKASA